VQAQIAKKEKKKKKKAAKLAAATELNNGNADEVCEIIETDGWIKAVQLEIF